MSEAGLITTGTLIAADKVNGTNVYNPAGDTRDSVKALPAFRYNIGN